MTSSDGQSQRAEATPLRPLSGSGVGLEVALAGGLSGMVNTLLFSPLDVVKTRMQAGFSMFGPGSLSSNPRSRAGTRRMLRMMLLEEGIRSYYRGLSVSLWAFVPNWALHWTIYEGMKQRLELHGRLPTPVAHGASAVVAGVVTSVATSPLWVVRTRMQVEIAKGIVSEYPSIFASLSNIARTEGVLALYKGLTPTLFGLLHVAVQFPLYEELKERFRSDDERALPPSKILAASSLSKAVASVVAYPHEVIRANLQACRNPLNLDHNEFREVLRLVRDIARTDGWPGIYRGLVPNLLRSIPANMVTFLTYELARQRFDHKR